MRISHDGKAQSPADTMTLPRVLIVDDDPAVLKLVKAILDPDYRCRTAANSAEARKALADETADILLSDIQMPGESGLSLIRFVRSAYPQTGVVVISIIDDPQAAMNAVSEGIQGYLIKPLDRHQLMITVANALKASQLDRLQQAYQRDLKAAVEKRSRALAASENRFRSLIEGSIQGILIHSGLTPVFVNAAFAAIHGYQPDEILAMERICGLIAPDEHERLLGFYRALLHGESAPAQYEYRGRHRNGTDIWLESRVVAVNWDSRRAIQLTVSDITHRKTAESALARANGEMSAIISNISSVLIGLSMDRRVTHWNTAAQKVFGIPANQVLGIPLSDCPVIWDAVAIETAIARCVTQAVPATIHDVAFVRADGKDGFIDLRMSLIDGATPTTTGILIIGVDITDRKRMQAQLSQAQKLESIGQLASGIAHEINTPCQYIGDNTRFLQDAFSDLKTVLEAYDRLHRAAAAGDALPEALSGVAVALGAADLGFLLEEIPLSIRQTLEGVDRVSRIVRSMKAFSHPGGDEKTAVDINQALESTITVARNEWKYVADLKTVLAPTLPPVRCLAGEMNQVFLNLIVNAAHAIADVVGDGNGGKGEITVTTGVADGMVEITIGDTGAGIPEAIGHRVFDPFFTTKGVGKGTGQGLAIAYATVTEKHGGRIFFTSEPGRGTTFHIHLPVE